MLPIDGGSSEDGAALWPTPSSAGLTPRASTPSSSGVSLGLFCANLLAEAGLEVLGVMERHSVLGGYCSGFRRKGFLFDSASHFYPLLGNPETLTGKILRALEIPTEWVKMDPVDQFHLPGLPAFAVPADYDAFLAKLRAWFPEESEAIGRYFDELRSAYLCGLLQYFKGVDNPRAARYESFSIQDKVGEHFRNPHLRALLMADAPHWGSLPSKTSFLFDAMLRLSYFLGNYYPKGGSQRFADDLGRGITRRGGQVVRCLGAEQIVVDNGEVRGVRARTYGKREPEEFVFRAPVVVSNADLRHTVHRLLPPGIFDEAYMRRLDELRPSLPCFLVHIGLRGMDPQRLAEVEGYHWQSLDPDDASRNVFKVFVPTRFDPSIAPPGCQEIIIQKITPVPFDQITDWQAHKAAVEKQIFTRLRELLPDLDQHIVVRLSATAMTSHRYTGNDQGAMLGWEMAPDQLNEARPDNRTPIRNLYLTGHWTRPGGGVTPVIVSAQRTAKMILKGDG
ncbi:MAG: NAD(P)/FAD-dependent oxidoreductase [Bryobacterales bacterium]